MRGRQLIMVEPLPIGTLVNPEPPEPPVGTELAMEHRPDECVWYHGEHGWRMPEWDTHPAVARPATWQHVRTMFGPLVVCGFRGHLRCRTDPCPYCRSVRAALDAADEPETDDTYLAPGEEP